MTRLRRQLEPDCPGVSWVPEENYHVTLRFLGEIAESDYETLDALVRDQYACLMQFEAKLGGIGAFPSLRHPAVLWAGVASPDNMFRRLNKVAETAAQCLGLQAEVNRFHPHVTLGRVRARRGGKREEGRLSATPEALADFEGDVFQIAHVALFLSELSPQGSRYRAVKDFPLHA